MYRLLIVDDEEKIVNGLYDIFIDIKKYDLDVYKAYSGEEAIEWMDRTRIDIVLTDIRMPEINGLQLLDVIYRNWPQCRVIFLTSYSELEYVYKAIRRNGVSYIMKTEDYEKVINAVENTIEDIHNGINIEKLIHSAKEQINMALELFQKDYLKRLLHEDSSQNITQSQFDQLEIPMYSNKPVLLLLGQIDNFPTDLSYSSKIQYLYSVRLIINQYLKTNITSVCVMDETYRFVLFIQPKGLFDISQIQTEIAAGYKKIVSFLKGTLEVIQTVCRESLDVSISFALSGEPCRWENLSEKYYSLNQLLNYRIGIDIEMLLVDNEIKNDIINTSSEVPEMDADIKALELLIRQQRMDAIELYLESGQKDKFFEILAQWGDPLKLIQSKNSNAAIEAYYKISLSLLSHINRCKLTEKIAFHLDQNRLMRIDKFDSWEEAVEYIYQLSNVIFRLQSEEKKKRADKAVNYIQKFIEENISEDLSLVRLSEQVFLNPSYLSRLYKQVFGVNLSEFIDRVRIKRAKELLEKENVKIYEVAKMVGYETATSFTRFFRKGTGRSPQEYHNEVLLSKHK
ncbi:response regulator [Clostridium sp. E02]|uniref:response regulator transcription factor n=1 Tax=Clostridium sp. E02 TaxID=2487134 RepID=UPI000F52C39E|nr:response regulator [Clostridium sp. E02]